MELAYYYYRKDCYKLSLDEFNIIAKSTSVTIRSDIAYSECTPLSVLYELMCDNHHRVRYWVAKNKNSDTIILDRLSKDIDQEVKFAVALNNNTSVEALIRIADDTEVPSYVRSQAIYKLDQKLSYNKENNTITDRIKQFLYNLSRNNLIKRF